MADFLSKAKALNAETVELLGEKVEVRGISIGDLVALTKPKKGEEHDSLTLTSALIAFCCYKADGSKLVPEGKAEIVREWTPAVFNVLNDAVTRVNGNVSGNSKATGKGD